MKALTVRQPWASLIVAGVKDVENRSWAAPERLVGERIGIHAAKFDTDNDPSIPESAWDALGVVLGGVAPPRGKLLGTAWLADCHHGDDCEHICPEHGCDTCSDPLGSCGHLDAWPVAPEHRSQAARSPDATWPSQCDVHGWACENYCSPWAQEDTHHWVLYSVRPCIPVPMRGHQGLWELSAEAVPA